MIKIGIYGDTGMVGAGDPKGVETPRPGATIAFRQNSRRREGNLADCDVVFLATKDPESMTFAPEALAAGAKVIDMSGAFRLPREAFERGYGLVHTAPELLKEAVLWHARFVCQTDCQSASGGQSGLLSHECYFGFVPPQVTRAGGSDNCGDFGQFGCASRGGGCVK